VRRRLLVAFIGLALVTVIVYGAPRAFFLADLVRAQEQDRLDRTADLVADTLAWLPPEERTDVARLRGIVRGTETLTVVSGGVRARIGSSTAVDDLRATRSLPDGGQLFLSERSSVVKGKVSDALLPLLLAGMATLAIAVIAASFLSRRLTRPFSDLTALADEMGAGRFDVEVPVYGLREADSLVRALQRMAFRVGEMLGHERELAARLSHELRSPLTSLRLVLDELGADPGLSEGGRADLRLAVEQSDRLTRTVTAVLDDARLQREASADYADLGVVLAASELRWGQGFGTAGRAFSVSVVDDAVIAAPSGMISQILDAIVEDSLTNGRGATKLTLVAGPEHARLRLDDERETLDSKRIGSGPLTLPPAMARAADLARSLGGRLVVSHGASATLDLFLPLIRSDAARGDESVE
jgi:signal transduction histidine kinase